MTCEDVFMTTPTVMTEWFRHVPDDKWLRDPAQSKKDAQAIWNTLRLQPGVRIFECPCGKADLGFPLARLGALIEGMEFNAHFVTAARNKFFRAGLKGDFRTDDMRRAAFPENVDLIINWASSFGFFSDEGNEDLLRRFAAALRPEGELLIEVANPVRVIAGETTRLIATGDAVPETWDAEHKRATVVFPATAFRGPVAASIRIYTTEEYRGMLEKAGLKLTGFYGEQFTEYNEASQRLIVRASKP